MSFKTIVVAVISALVAIILYKNTEQSSFWLFGDIYTSKLILLGIFYLIGVITGGILFRRKSKHPKEYAISNQQEEIYASTNQDYTKNINSTSNLSDEDRDFLSRD